MKFSLSTAAIIAITGSVTVGGALFGGYLWYAHAQTPPPPPFPPPISLNPGALTARSAIVYDPSDDRILFEKDAETPRPLASLTKLMSATVVLQSAHKNDLAHPVTITQADIVPEGDEGDWGFKAGYVATLGDLIKFGLVASSNDAMAAAAESLGGNYLNDMNAEAGVLGLSHTYFLNPTGLDESTESAGAYGSAEDVAKLAAAFFEQYPQYFELTADPVISIDASGHTLVANATAKPLESIPGFIGAKTGYTTLAGGNLVAAFDLEMGHPLIAVVLGSTDTGRFTDIETLIAAARQSLAAE